MTRRHLMLATPAALLAQPPQPPQQLPAQPPIPASPEQELSAARDQLQRAAGQLAKVPLAIDAEPACIFKP